MYEHNALGYRSGLALFLTKVRSSQTHCPATALIHKSEKSNFLVYNIFFYFLLFNTDQYALFEISADTKKSIF